MVNMEKDPGPDIRLAEKSMPPNSQRTASSSTEGSSHQSAQRPSSSDFDNDEPQWKSPTNKTRLTRTLFSSSSSSDIWETTSVNVLDEVESVYLEGDSSSPGWESSVSPAYHYELEPESFLPLSPGAEIDLPEKIPENIMLNRQGSIYWQSSNDFFHGEPLPKSRKRIPGNPSQQREPGDLESQSPHSGGAYHHKIPEARRIIAKPKRTLSSSGYPATYNQPERTAVKVRLLNKSRSRSSSTSKLPHPSAHGLYMYTTLLDITNQLTASAPANEKPLSSIDSARSNVSDPNVALQKYSQKVNLRTGALHKAESLLTQTNIDSAFKMPSRIMILTPVGENKAEGVSQFRCTKGCEELKFETWKGMYEHYLHKHNQCSYCYEISCDGQVHQQKIGEYSCRYCTETFRHAGTLTQHLWFHPHSKPYYCHFCHKHSTIPEWAHKEACLYAYVSNMLRTTFQCKECPMKVVGFDRHYKHCIQKHKQYLCRCCVGTRPFPTLTDLQSHIDTAHFQCKYCLYQIFHFARDLNRHVQKDHMGPPFECSTCEKSFQTLAELETHVASQSEVFEPFVIHCRLCKTTYTESRIFLVHRKTVPHQRKIAAIAQKNCLL